MTYRASDTRYDSMQFRRTGQSGLKLPAISLGLWQNFGGTRDYPSAFEILSYAFDHGVTHFDLANNYGPPPGAAEELFGDIMARDFRPYRDELIISSKAGWGMWPGPYGDLGSRKYLIASCEQSLKRMGLDYVDIFYSHRFDPETPLEETMGALAQLHRQGKALYVGISSYPREQTREAHRILSEMGVPLLIHQPSYSILNRWIEDDDTIGACGELGVGVIAFSPLAQGVLSGKYSKGIEGTRAEERNSSINRRALAPKVLAAVEALGKLAKARKQTLVQFALAWVLRRKEMTSALIGVRTLEQLKDCLGALDNLEFTTKELTAIDAAVKGALLDQRPAT
ncbi:MAG: aldo/keto reductase [Devosia nanyangense]|uniref:Aldo/keto reductase n=1 Tax=Devosia nanyangense TaxID=1228055 RepID=A0A933KZW9_9HYPH|nr:aldo/keto reductase [Devosia nanyangense]